MERAHASAVDPDWIVSITARIVKGYVTGNRLPPDGVIELMSTVGEVLRSLNRPVSGLEAVRRPPGQAALPVGDGPPTEEEIRASIGETYLVSFEDGKPYHKLDWHLTRRGLTPETYRAKWGLPDDYPMIAQSFMKVWTRPPTLQEIRASIGETFLISFEDGKPYHLLTKHLAVRGLTPEAYRAKWGLPDDYPMMPAFYRKKRADNAFQVGLGYWDRTRGESPSPEPDPKRSGARRRRGKPAASTR